MKAHSFILAKAVPLVAAILLAAFLSSCGTAYRVDRRGDRRDTRYDRRDDRYDRRLGYY